MSRYTVLYSDRGEGLTTGGCVTIQSLYRDKWEVWLRACHDIIDCIVTGGQRLGRWLCRDTDATRSGEALRHSAGAHACALRYGRSGLRHGRARLKTRPGQASDTAHCACRAGQGVHLVHPTQFWTQCTVFESLFGTLFMTTVHEHCSANFSKKKGIIFFSIK